MKLLPCAFLSFEPGANDSTAYIHGTVNGNVNNIGGFVEVFGTVNGKVICESGVCLIDSKGAVTGGLS